MTAQRPATVGIVGAGVMGAGIAQLALEGGHETILHDVDEAALAHGRDRIEDGLTRRAAKTGVDPTAIDDWVDERLARLRETESLGEVAKDCEVVIEAALESLDLKRSIFATLDDLSAPTAILATNTSALSIASVAAAAKRPNRVIGLHFFNPAPLMALVEVVAGPATDQATVDSASALVMSWGKTPIRSADTPGFIVNRVNRPFTIEALRILEEGGAPVVAIDAAMREAGFPLGPFELMDLTGIDVTFAAATGVWDGLGRPDRLRPSSIQEQLIAAGHLGRKTGRGFYQYVDGKRLGVALEGEPGASRIPAEGISARILAAIDAEARAAADEGVASAADIDLALRLGAAHPIGPFERASTIRP
jgi:3-hydroxybutyryl-CoA dehydrogenase